ncbi:unnamed protein product, partial [Urochloa humidicola]
VGHRLAGGAWLEAKLLSPSSLLRSELTLHLLHFALSVMDDEPEPRWCKDGKAAARGYLQALHELSPLSA